MHHRVLRLLFAAVLASSMLLSVMPPALAVQGWPNSWGGLTGSSPQSFVSAPGGPVAVPADQVAGPVFAEENIGSVPSALASRMQQLRRVPAAVDVNPPLQGERNRSQTPADISVGRDMSPEVAALAAAGDSIVNAVVHLDKPSLARVGQTMSAEERAAYAEEVAAYQERVIAEVESGGGTIYARFRTLSSGFIARMPGREVPRIAGLPEVERIGRVNDYEKDLSETVPFIGGSLLQDLGLTGEGTNVAVLDSGIDFTHLAFGGPGTQAAYEAAYFGGLTDCTFFGDPTCANAKVPDPALFGPNAPKVKGGWDWVGMAWPTYGAEMPDPNPIDSPESLGGGHGTHVADIIAGYAYAAGVNADGPYPAKGVGMAPGANIYAYQVCSSISTSCSGIALLAGMDDAADLDNNPATKDPADVLNMSLGSSYGQPEDDLTFFTNLIVDYGTIVVASAGNSADKPFIVGSPSIADGAISVAQTQVPSAKQFLPTIDTPVAIAGPLTSAVWQPWSVDPADAGTVSGAVAYGNADGSNLNGCAPYTTDMTGKVVLADRGTCNFTAKAKNASAAGAVLSIIGLVAPGDPFSGGDGGDRPIDIPSFMISQGESNKIKSQLAAGVSMSLDPSKFISLAYGMVGSSSRGPRNHDNKIKPDIGAPGASVSAITGTGANIGPFGGTSGAAPMVSGAAALLKGFFGDQLLPQQYKALLMNSANSTVYNVGAKNPDDSAGTLAPITRIGGGQVDVAKAYQNRILAWDATDANPLAWTGSLSFGYVATPDSYTATRVLAIKNLAALGQTVSLNSSFRYADDVAQGVNITPMVSSVYINAGQVITVPVVLEVDSGGIKPWALNKGSMGASGAGLSYQEYDGYLTISGQTDGIATVPWHVLPKAVADVSASMGAPSLAGKPGSGTLSNASPANPGESEAFYLVAQNPNDYGYIVGDCDSIGADPGCNFSPVDLKEVGVRDWSAGYLEFALTLWDEPFRAGQYPVEFDIYVDVNRDGTDDFVIFNADLALNGSDGRNAVFVQNLTTNAYSAYFFTDSDFNTQNYILTVPTSVLGLAAGQKFDFRVYAFDAYFGGSAWDCSPRVGDTCSGYHTVTRGTPRFNLGESQYTLETEPNSETQFTYTFSRQGDAASPSQIGLLFLHRYAPVGRESDALVLPVPRVTYLPLIVNNYNAADWLNLTILHTNDFHARVDEYNVSGARCKPDDATAGLCIAGAPRLATAVSAIRDQKANVLLVDAGDQFQGTLFYNVFKGDVLTATMNYIGYDAMAIGNHEFDNGPTVLASFIEGANFPVLSANIDASADTHLNGKIAPYVVVERGGHEIGIIGLTTPETSNISSPGPNITFTDPVTSLQGAADALTAMGVDKIIALTHMGYDVDVTLAAQVSGVDVIVGGHSHSFLYSPVAPKTFTPPNLSLTPAGSYPTVVESLAEEPVLVVSAYQWGTFLGNLDVSFNPDGVVYAYAGNPIYLDRNVAKNPGLDALLDPYRAAVAGLIATEVGETTVNLPISVGGQRICRLGECLMGNLVADAMLDKANEFFPGANYQIAFQNGGGLRAPIVAGPVTMGDVLETLPFGNAIATFELTGEYVKAALENGARLYPSENGGFAQVAGMRYTINPTQPVGSRIVSAEVWNGVTWEPLVMAAMYKVVTNDFMRRGGDNYLMFRDHAVNPYDFGPALDEALADYFLTNSPVTPVIEGRISIAP